MKINVKRLGSQTNKTSNTVYKTTKAILYVTAFLVALLLVWVGFVSVISVIGIFVCVWIVVLVLHEMFSSITGK